MRTDFAVRLRIIFFGVLICIIGIVFRLYSVQILNGEGYLKDAESQYYKTASEVFDRGSIFFTDKSGELISAGTEKVGYTLAVNPDAISNAESVFERLLVFIPDLPKEEFIRKASKVDDPYEEILDRLDIETAEKIAIEGIPGVLLYRKHWRFYPGDRMASHTLGFVSYDNENNMRGQYGVERYYNEVLERNTESRYVNFFAELFSGIDSLLSKDDKNRKGNVVLTIEPTIQLLLEKKLEEVHKKYKSELTAGIIIDPRTGAMRALAATPDFNPNTFNVSGSEQFYSNPNIQDVYEMGSIIKALTVAIGLDTNAITSETTFYDGGSVTLNNAKISNYDGRGRGVVDMQEVLNQSLNTGSVFVYQEVGNEKYREYMLELGLGEETGVDLPFEIRGLVDNLDTGRDIELATASFGQGIALTPIGTVRALSALASGGTLPVPHVLSEIRYPGGTVKENVPFEGRRIFSEETSDEITRMLVEVVDSALRDGYYKHDRYSIAAKTGTAQIVDPVTKKYSTEDFLHSFFGYFPAYDPEFLVFLFTVKPQNVSYASETLTEPFMDITDFLINYYDIAPDRQ
ncbi:MAG: penicillin-binding protein 2 [Candidatus Paceibacterota bacterium]